MKLVTVEINSDLFEQVKPSRLSQLKLMLEAGAKHSPYPFNYRGLATTVYSKNRTVYAIDRLKFTVSEVHELLNKALNLVQDTEEYAEHLLLEAFDDSKNKRYSTPPGTVRFYAQDLICFYNGKTWRKIKV